MTVYLKNKSKEYKIIKLEGMAVAAQFGPEETIAITPNDFEVLKDKLDLYGLEVVDKEKEEKVLPVEDAKVEELVTGEVVELVREEAPAEEAPAEEAPAEEAPAAEEAPKDKKRNKKIKKQKTKE